MDFEFWTRTRSIIAIVIFLVVAACGKSEDEKSLLLEAKLLKAEIEAGINLDRLTERTYNLHVKQNLLPPNSEYKDKFSVVIEASIATVDAWDKATQCKGNAAEDTVEACAFFAPIISRKWAIAGYDAEKAQGRKTDEVVKDMLKVVLSYLDASLK